MPLSYPRIATFLVWAMIPLTLVSGLPRVGCICANGERKLICDSLAGGSVGCSKSCCHSPTSDPVKTDSRKTDVGATVSVAAAEKAKRPSCCHHHQKQRPVSDQQVVAGGKLCRQELHRPLYVTTETQAVSEHFAVEFIGAVEMLPQVDAVTCVARLFEPNRVPPPRDLVVQFGAWLI